MINIFYKNKYSKGFLLVEMLVSVGIFAVVMTIGMGSLLSLISVSKKSQAFKTVVNNLNLAVEGMSREIRTGYDYNCGSFGGGDCPNGADSIYFTSKSGSSVVYRINNNRIEKSVDGSSFVSLTSPDVVVDNLFFYINGSSPADSIQPRVVLIIQAHSGQHSRDFVSFGLQTLISQRVITP